MILTFLCWGCSPHSDGVEEKKPKQKHYCLVISHRNLLSLSCSALLLNTKWWAKWLVKKKKGRVALLKQTAALCSHYFCTQVTKCNEIAYVREPGFPILVVVCGGQSSGWVWKQKQGPPPLLSGNWFMVHTTDSHFGSLFRLQKTELIWVLVAWLDVRLTYCA